MVFDKCILELKFIELTYEIICESFHGNLKSSLHPKI
jgi:hypothetical protein